MDAYNGILALIEKGGIIGFLFWLYMNSKKEVKAAHEKVEASQAKVIETLDAKKNGGEKFRKEVLDEMHTLGKVLTGVVDEQEELKKTVGTLQEDVTHLKEHIKDK